MGRQRVAYVDLAKGFCIALVVLFHVKGIIGYSNVFDPLLSVVRLPLYFFLSGLFFKDYGSWLRFLTKKTNRLLIPFLFFYLCFSVAAPSVFHFLFGISFATVTGWPLLWAFLWPGVYPNIPIWFLWCLFLMNLLFYVLSFLFHGKGFLLGVACLVSGIVGEWFLQLFPTDFGTVCKALQSMPFFYFGYLFSHHQGLSRLATLSSVAKLLAVLLLLLSAALVTRLLPYHLLLYYLAGLCATLAVLLLSSLIGYLPLFSYIGRYSIMLLLTHGLLIKVVTPVCIALQPTVGSFCSVVITASVLLLSYYLIIPLMRRYLPYVTAQKTLLSED